jgi:hypothetical protein
MRLGLAPYMDATFPIYFDSVRIMTHYPKVENRSVALIAVFSKTVNLCLCLKLILSFRFALGVGLLHWFRSSNCHHFEIFDRLRPSCFRVDSSLYIWSHRVSRHVLNSTLTDKHFNCFIASRSVLSMEVLICSNNVGCLVFVLDNSGQRLHQNTNLSAVSSVL